MALYNRPGGRSIGLGVAAVAVLAAVSACSSDDATSNRYGSTPLSSPSTYTYPPTTAYVPPRDSYPTSAPAGGSTAGSNSASHSVSGVVLDRGGRPVAGVTVQFRNLLGRSGITETDSSGRYRVSLPEDVYQAFALDERPDSGNNYVAVGGNSISVPPTSRVDFVQE